MSLIHDSLRRLESKQLNKVATDSNVYTGYVDTTQQSLFNKSWVVGLLVFVVLLIIFALISYKNIGFNNLDLLNPVEHINERDDLITQKYTNQTSKYPSLIYEAIDAPVVIAQPATKINKTEKETTEVSLPKTIKKFVQVQKEPSKNVVPRVTSQQKIILKKPAATKKKPPLLFSKVQKLSKVQELSKTKEIKSEQKPKLTVKETRHLVNNLQMYIEERNEPKVKSLLAQLQKSSGSSSLVYLRMFAYWSTIQKDDETAIGMYKKILLVKPNDIQAGTNLALIEARQNKSEQALKRLKSLLVYYPSNKSIKGYIKKIEVMK